jgi:hypothetical protein
MHSLPERVHFGPKNASPCQHPPLTQPPASQPSQGVHTPRRDRQRGSPAPGRPAGRRPAAPCTSPPGWGRGRPPPSPPSARRQSPAAPRVQTLAAGSDKVTPGRTQGGEHHYSYKLRRAATHLLHRSQQRRDELARPAPRRPKVHQHRAVCLRPIRALADTAAGTCFSATGAAQPQSHRTAWQTCCPQTCPACGCVGASSAAGQRQRINTIQATTCSTSASKVLSSTSIKAAVFCNADARHRRLLCGLPASRAPRNARASRRLSAARLCADLLQVTELRAGAAGSRASTPCWHRTLLGPMPGCK